MPKNPKQTSAVVASQAGQILQDKNASVIKKQLAASVLAQAGTAKQTGAELEVLAAKTMQDGRVSDETKTVAASALAQANKARKAPRKKT